MENHGSPPFRWHYTIFDDRNFQIRGRTLFFVIVLLCLVIFITLLYLYALWVCQSRPERSPIHLPHAPPQNPPSEGLDPTGISRLPIILHRNSLAGSEIECSICLGILQDGEKVKVLPDCSHCYHSECVDRWLRNQSSCPLCRSSLRVVSVV